MINTFRKLGKVRTMSYQYRKIDGWSVFALSGLGIDIDKLFQMSYNGKNKLDDIKMINDTRLYIDNYKKSKLKHFKNFINLD